MRNKNRHSRAVLATQPVAPKDMSKEALITACCSADFSGYLSTFLAEVKRHKWDDASELWARWEAGPPYAKKPQEEPKPEPKAEPHLCATGRCMNRPMPARAYCQNHAPEKPRTEGWTLTPEQVAALPVYRSGSYLRGWWQVDQRSMFSCFGCDTAYSMRYGNAMYCSGAAFYCSRHAPADAEPPPAARPTKPEGEKAHVCYACHAPCLHYYEQGGREYTGLVVVCPACVRIACDNGSPETEHLAAKKIGGYAVSVDWLQWRKVPIKPASEKPAPLKQLSYYRGGCIRGWYRSSRVIESKSCCRKMVGQGEAFFHSGQWDMGYCVDCAPEPFPEGYERPGASRAPYGYPR